MIAKVEQDVLQFVLDAFNNRQKAAIAGAYLWVGDGVQYYGVMTCDVRDHLKIDEEKAVELVKGLFGKGLLQKWGGSSDSFESWELRTFEISIKGMNVLRIAKDELPA